MVCRDRVRDRLEQHRLSCSRRRHDQTALSFSDRGQQIEDACRKVVLSVRRFELQPLVWIERCQVIEKDLVSGLIWVLEIDGLDFDECEVALSVLWRTHLA